MFFEVAPHFELEYYIKMAFAFCVFWTVYQILSHFLWMLINPVYRNKSVKDRAEYLSYSTSMFHGPASTVLAYICIFNIW